MLATYAYTSYLENLAGTFAQEFEFSNVTVTLVDQFAPTIGNGLMSPGPFSPTGGFVVHANSSATVAPTYVATVDDHGNWTFTLAEAEEDIPTFAQENSSGNGDDTATAANNESYAWTFTKAFFTGFSLFGPKNDPRPSCFGMFLSNSATNFVGVPGVDTMAAAGTSYYGISQLSAQAVPNTRTARGGISPSQWLDADDAARLSDAGTFSFLSNADVAMAQAFFQSELPAALSGQCK